MTTQDTHDEMETLGVPEPIRDEVRKHLLTMQGGKKYLQVPGRLIWFRHVHPEYGIDAKFDIIDLDRQMAVCTARVFDEGGRLLSVGTKSENAKGFPDYIEKAQTGAIGRALATLGYGTHFAPELCEGTERIVDTPAAPAKPARARTLRLTTLADNVDDEPETDADTDTDGDQEIGDVPLHAPAGGKWEACRKCGQQVYTIWPVGARMPDKYNSDGKWHSGTCGNASLAKAV